MYLAADSMLMSAAGALEVESAKLVAVHLEFDLIPRCRHSLVRLGGFFAPLSGSSSTWPLERLSCLTRHIGGINDTRIHFQAVAGTHMGIMHIP